MNDSTRLEQPQTIFYAYAHITKSMSIMKTLDARNGLITCHLKLNWVFYDTSHIGYDLCHLFILHKKIV
jgi:hypothetical protein